MKNLIYYTLIITISALTYFYFSSSEQRHLSSELEEYRHDQQVTLSKDSITETTNQLKFFTASNLFQSKVTLIPIKDTGKPVLFQKSKIASNFIPIEIISFEIKRKEYRLIAFKTNKNNIIIPFTDLTNNQSTSIYGRLIPYETIKKNLFIDFNLAFNPACEYATKFDCLTVPKSNHIPLYIKAGEKRFKD